MFHHCMIKFYNKCLENYSLATNCITALVVYTVGDVAAQYIELKNNKKSVELSKGPAVYDVNVHVPSSMSITFSFVDWSRTQEMLVWSAGIYTPAFVLLYKKMDIIWPTSSVRHVCMKIATSSLSNIPALSLFFAFGVTYPRLKEYTMSRMKGEGNQLLDVSKIVEGTKSKIENDMIPTLTSGFAYWWPVNAFIFRFIPMLLRPVGMSVFSVAWGCYLSLVQYKQADSNEYEDIKTVE